MTIPELLARAEAVAADVAVFDDLVYELGEAIVAERRSFVARARHFREAYASALAAVKPQRTFYEDGTEGPPGRFTEAQNEGRKRLLAAIAAVDSAVAAAQKDSPDWTPLKTLGSHPCLQAALSSPLHVVNWTDPWYVTHKFS